jgi:predicted DNA-binding transcriptional regulator AlpA
VTEERAAIGPDRLISPSEVASRLGVTVRWVYRHADQWPFTRKLSRKVLRFSEAGFGRWLQARRP